MAKVAISLPDDVFEAIEKNRLAIGITRSEVIRKAIEEYLRHEKKRQLEDQYIQGYLDCPETAEEIDWVASAGLAALAGDSWEQEEED